MVVTFINAFEAGWRIVSRWAAVKSAHPFHHQANVELRLSAQLCGLSRNLWHGHVGKESKAQGFGKLKYMNMPPFLRPAISPGVKLEKKDAITLFTGSLPVRERTSLPVR